jgi:hypothetical protein
MSGFLFHLHSGFAENEVGTCTALAEGVHADMTRSAAFETMGVTKPTNR